MRKLLFLIACSLLLPLSALAQTTSVTGTVTSAWSGATYTISFVGQPGVQYTTNGAAVTCAGQAPPCTGTLSGAGAITTILLSDNNATQPGGSQWKFTIVAPAGIPSFSIQQTITGATQSISTALQAAAPSLVAPVPLLKSAKPGTTEVHTQTGGGPGLVVSTSQGQTSPAAIFSDYQGNAGIAILPGTKGILFPDGTTQTTAFTGSGGGSVTSVATTSPITGGPITTTGTIACATCATTTNGGALSGTAPVAVSAAGAISCTTCATTTNGGALSGTAPVAVSAAGAISITGAAGQVLAGAAPAFTATPTLGVASSTAGSLTIAPNGAASPTTEGQIEWDGSLLLPAYGSSSTTFNGPKEQYIAVAPGANSVYDDLCGAAVTGCVTAGTTETAYVTTVTIPIGELINNKMVRITFNLQTVGVASGTAPTFTVRANAGCTAGTACTTGTTVAIAVGSAQTSGTLSGQFVLIIGGTTAAGASAATSVNAFARLNGAQISNIVSPLNLATNGAIVLQPTMKYAATAVANQVQITGVLIEYF